MKLKHKSDGAITKRSQPVGTEILHVFSLNPNFSGAGFIERSQYMQQGAFAGPGSANHRYHFARHHLKAYASQYRNKLFGQSVGLDEILHGYQWLHARHLSLTKSTLGIS